MIQTQSIYGYYAIDLYTQRKLFVQIDQYFS